MWSQIPQQQVVVSAITGQLVSLAHQGLSQCTGIGFHVLGVLFEHGTVHLQELCGQGTNLMIVRTALQGREDRHVDALLDVRNLLRIFEEDHASTWPSQGLVRGGRHHIAMFEGTWMFSSGHEATDVRNVCHQNGTHLVRDAAELSEVDDARIGGSTAQDHCWPEDQSCLSELIKVDQPGLRMHSIRQGLEVDRSGADLLLGGVVAMCQVSTRW
mmetsp:Transcript_30715/g.66187  ORF Transcript_30715/g.66187 Transcript_30715/m.66187 type:complete len:214 (-) Transcript_30715:1297-1938(-)